MFRNNLKIFCNFLGILILLVIRENCYFDILPRYNTDTRKCATHFGELWSMKLCVWVRIDCGRRSHKMKSWFKALKAIVLSQTPIRARAEWFGDKVRTITPPPLNQAASCARDFAASSILWSWIIIIIIVTWQLCARRALWQGAVRLVAFAGSFVRSVGGCCLEGGKVIWWRRTRVALACCANEQCRRLPPRGNERDFPFVTAIGKNVAQGFSPSEHPFFPIIMLNRMVFPNFLSLLVFFARGCVFCWHCVQ